VREELRETEKNLTKITNNSINKALEDMWVVMERMMERNKDKHSDEFSRRWNYYDDFETTSQKRTS